MPLLPNSANYINTAISSQGTQGCSSLAWSWGMRHKHETFLQLQSCVRYQCDLEGRVLRGHQLSPWQDYGYKDAALHAGGTPPPPHKPACLRDWRRLRATISAETEGKAEVYQVHRTGEALPSLRGGWPPLLQRTRTKVQSPKAGPARTPRFIGGK